MIVVVKHTITGRQFIHDADDITVTDDMIEVKRGKADIYSQKKNGEYDIMYPRMYWKLIGKCKLEGAEV